MEKVIGAIIPHRSKHITLISSLDQYQHSQQIAYFYTDIPDVICVAANYDIIYNKYNPFKFSKQSQVQFRDNNQNRIKTYDEDGIFHHEGKKYYYVLYTKINTNSNLVQTGKWLSESDIMELAEFLLGMVIELKQKKIFFGGFYPSRIFQSKQLKSRFYILNSQFLQTQTMNNIQYRDKMQQIFNFQAQDFRYLAPQLLSQQSFQIGYKTDLFSVCSLLYELIFQHYPFFSRQNLIKAKISHNSGSQNLSPEILKLINEKVLCQNNPQDRIEPEQLLKTIQAQKNMLLFKTQRNMDLMFNKNDQNSSSSLLQNIQDFFVKCTKQTQGWILHYCQATTYPPDQKYFGLILQKLYKNIDKNEKIITTLKRISNNFVFCKTIENKSGLYQKGKQKQTKNYEESTWSAIKLAMIMLKIIRQCDMNSKSIFLAPFKKIAIKMCQKKVNHTLITFAFKIVNMKTIINQKIPFYLGNFFIKIQDFQQITINDFQYLSQYSLKLVNYLGKITLQYDETTMNQLQKSFLTLICDELYDATSALILGLIAHRKDIVLNLKQASDSNVQQRTNQNCLKLLSQIQKLSYQSLSISSHCLYSIMSDSYAYLQQINLLYQPIISSLQYFMFDTPKYKGLRVSCNNPKTNLKQKYYQNNDIFRNRVLIKQKKQKIDNTFKKEKAKTNMHKNFDYEFQIQEQQILKSQGSKISQNSQSKISPNTKINHNSPQKITTSLKCIDMSPNPTKLQYSERSTPSQITNGSRQQQQNFDFVGSDIHSFQWLKSTEKIITKMFKKPQIDATIHFLYEQICKGLKLQELIEALAKNKKFIIDPSLVLFQKIIGSGSAGQVYIGKYQQKVVAIKKVKTLTNPMALKEFEREVLTFLKIKNHPYLVSLVGLTKYNDDYFLLTEFCEGGALFDLLHKKTDIELKWFQRLKLIKQIAIGMKFLHDLNPPVIHRDMKSLNVFIAKIDGMWTAKVADFGLSRSPDASLMTSALGTLHWMAPQLLCNKQYSMKVDIYSFGIVVWEICSRKTPYHTLKTPFQIVKHVVNQKGRPQINLINQGCPESLIRLMQRCWSQTSQERPMFDEIIEVLEKIRI